MMWIFFVFVENFFGYYAPNVLHCFVLVYVLIIVN